MKVGDLVKWGKHVFIITKGTEDPKLGENLSITHPSGLQVVAINPITGNKSSIPVSWLEMISEKIGSVK